jgi:DNA-directed RNA polymerase subunit RPC12/RpoP
MGFVLLRLREFESGRGSRPGRCPYCGGEVLQRWGKGCSTVNEDVPTNGSNYRYRCENCRRTFRYDSLETTRDLAKQLVRNIAGIAWALGMSSRSVVNSFSRLGYPLSRMTVWREGQRTISGQNGGGAAFKKPFVMDDLYVQGITHKLGVVVVLDFGSGRSAVLGAVNGESPWDVKAWLETRLKGQPVDIVIGNTGLLHGYEIAIQPAACAD